MTLESTIRDAIAEAIAPLVDQVAQLRAQLELTAAPSDEVGGIRALGTWIGCRTIAGAKARVHRDKALRELELTKGKRGLRWRKSEVLAHLERNRTRTAPTLRSIGAVR